MGYDIFTGGLNFQKEMMEMWKKGYEDLTKMGKNNEKGEGAEDSNIYQKSYNDFMKNWTNFFQGNEKINNMDLFNFSNQQGALQKMFTGMQSYQNLFLFWKELSLITPIDTPEKLLSFNEQWRTKYFSIIKDSVLAVMPENMKSIFNQMYNLTNQYSEFGDKLFKPWMGNMDEFQEDFAKAMKGDKNVYLDFYKRISESYNNSFGKIFNISGFGLGKESIEKQTESFNSYIEVINSFNEMFAMVYQSMQETMESLAGEYQKMYQSDETPKTFKEFYELWLKVNEDAMVKLFGTEEFSKLYGKFAESFCTFKIDYDKYLEMQLKVLPLPTKTDMNSLYKTVYDQKKEARALRKEVDSLQEKLNDLTEKLNKK